MASKDLVVTEAQLTHMFRAVGRFHGRGVLNTEGVDRTDTDEVVELLETVPFPIKGPCLEDSVWVDGIQAATLLRYREHRPVFLCYTAAGAGTTKAVLANLLQDLAIVGSVADRDWMDTVAHGIKVEHLATVGPPDVETEARLYLGRQRGGLERKIVTALVDKGYHGIMVDGGLIGRPVGDGSQMVGVIKSVTTKYLADESILWSLREGWRSPIFKLKAGTHCPVDRFSCYVRLQDAEENGWTHGLIRLETHDRELLDKAAVLAMRHRQNQGSADGRWDRHLEPVRLTEDLLRAHRPPIFNIL